MKCIFVTECDYCWCAVCCVMNGAVETNFPLGTLTSNPKLQPFHHVNRTFDEWLKEKVQLSQQDFRVTSCSHAALSERDSKRDRREAERQRERNRFWRQYICFRLVSCFFSCWAGTGLNKLALDQAQTSTTGLCIALTQYPETPPWAGWLWLCVLRGTARQAQPGL